MQWTESGTPANKKLEYSLGHLLTPQKFFFNLVVEMAYSGTLWHILAIHIKEVLLHSLKD